MPNEKTPLKEDEATVPGGGPYNKINWLKGGILSADKVLTVSPNYASEISRDDSSGVVSIGGVGMGFVGCACEI